MPRENAFQAWLIKRLSELFEGCIVLKLDSAYMQGIPDLLILYYDRWAILEVKVSANARLQPNQEYYLDRLNTMSYASIIHPDNAEEILYELQQALEA